MLFGPSHYQDNRKIAKQIPCKKIRYNHVLILLSILYFDNSIGEQAGILQEHLTLNDQARFGINSQIGCLAYNTVQSLLAIGTKESKFGNGQIYVFGQRRIEVTFTLPHQASVLILQFCARYLISLDSKNQLIIWDLATKRKLASTTPPGVATAMVTDLTLSWLIIGLQSGKIVVYDLDRKIWAPLKLPNFWHEKTHRLMVSPIVSMQLHPRDIGQLLIGYPDGAITYSFKLNKPTKYFEYTGSWGVSEELINPKEVAKLKKPILTQAMWHPTGTFIGASYDDSRLVFWDAKDGRILMARTLADTNENKFGKQVHENSSILEPIHKVVWCCKEDPENTALLVAGGNPTESSLKGLTLLELGTTPVYATASWQILTDFFKAKNERMLPVPSGAEVVDFCLIPHTSPHYAGAQDPIALIVLLRSGEIISLSYPEGHPISPTNQLHPSISFVHPFITSMDVCCMSRTRWLGMVEKRIQGPLLVKGGTEIRKSMNFSEECNLFVMAHGDGTVRVWDTGRLDQLENCNMLQVDIARALEKYQDINITALSLGSRTGELAVGIASGEVVIYSWGKNKFYKRVPSERVKTIIGGLIDISSRSEPSLDEGLQPRILYNPSQGPITTVKLSNIGFLVVGARSGGLWIIDLRGPAIILDFKLNDLAKQNKRSSLTKGKNQSSQTSDDWPVLIEFGVLTLEGDNYSSIVCFVGTNLGNVITFKILPSTEGNYKVQHAGSSSLVDRIISITPIVSDSGSWAEATGEAVANLRTGQQTNGLLVVVSQTEIRIFKPATAKGAHKNFGDYFCEAASIVSFSEKDTALVGIFGDATIRVYSLPGLKELSCKKTTILDNSRLSGSIITRTGSIFGWAGPSEVAMLNVGPTSQPLTRDKGILFNSEAETTPRPSISGIEWITGTQYITPADLDLLIGGPDRPPNVQIIAETEQDSRNAKVTAPTGAQNTESWSEYAARQINERTEKLNIVGDSVNRVQESSQSWADDVSKFVKKQKRNMIFGAVTGKFL